MATRTMKLVLAGDAKQLSRTLKTATGGIDKFAAGAQKAMRAAGVAIAAATAKGVRDFARFSKQVGEVGTLLGGPTSRAMDKLADDVRGVAKAFGQSTEQVSKAFYDSISAGVANAETAAGFASTAAKFATAGATDIATGVDALTSAMNAFKVDVADADKVSDTFFATVRAGKTTVPELAASFSQAGPVAAQLGLDLEELLGWVAQLTLSGTPTAQAMTQVRAALVALQKPSTILAKEFKKQAGTTFPEYIKAGGDLQGALKIVEQASASSGKSLVEMTGRVEGAQALMAVTGPEAAGFAKTLDSVRDSAGASAQAFDVMRQSADFRWNRLRAEANDLSLELGQSLTPALLELAEELLPLARDLLPDVVTVMRAAAAITSSVVIPAFRGLAWLLDSDLAPGLLAAAGALLAVKKAMAIIAMVKGLAIAFKGLAAAATLAQSALTLGLSLAITALVAWFIKAREQTGSTTGAIKKMANGFIAAANAAKDAMAWMLKQYFTPFAKAVDVAIAVINKMIGVYNKIPFVSKVPKIDFDASGALNELQKLVDSADIAYLKIDGGAAEASKSIDTSAKSISDSYRAAWKAAGSAGTGALTGMVAESAAAASAIRANIRSAYDLTGLTETEWENAYRPVSHNRGGGNVNRYDSVAAFKKAISRGASGAASRTASSASEGVASKTVASVISSAAETVASKTVANIVSKAGKKAASNYKLAPGAHRTYAERVASGQTADGLGGTYYRTGRYDAKTRALAEANLARGIGKYFGNGVPALASGGVVTRPTLALVGEKGPEAVIPLRGGGAGAGAVVNVEVNVQGSLLSATDLAEEVAEAVNVGIRSGAIDLDQR